MKKNILFAILIMAIVFTCSSVLDTQSEVYATSAKSKVTYTGVKNGKIYKTKKYVTINTKNEIKKVSITRNGKSIKAKKLNKKYVFTKDGKYVIKTTLKNKKKIYIVKFTVDKTKPTTNMKAKTYTQKSNGYKITFKDTTSGVKKATLNGKKIKQGKVVKKNGKYTLIITDKAGNKKTIKFTIACAHTYADATCIAPKTCTACGLTKGGVGTHNYIAGECEHCGDYNETYCPKLYFTGDLTEMTSKKDVREITFEYRSKEQKFDGAATIKLQGNSSLAYEKKNYTITLYEDTTYDDKLKVNVGWGDKSKYCLKANWIDKTHSRNVVSAKLAGSAQAKYSVMNQAPNNGAVDGFPVEIYVNGSFHGLYTMNIPKEDWMFGMDEDNPNHIVIGGEDYFLSTYFKEVPTNFDEWSVEIGQESDATLEKIQRLISFIKDSSDEEFVANFDQYLDLDSTLNYYVIMEVGYMADNHAKNLLLATYNGKVWYPTLYDLDTSWGTNWQGNGLFDYENEPLTERYSTYSILWNRVETLYSDKVAKRYNELRSDILSEENIMKEFNHFYNSIPNEVLERELEKWGGPSAQLPGYDLTQIQSYLDTILPSLDAKYGKSQS